MAPTLHGEHSSFSFLVPFGSQVFKSSIEPWCESNSWDRSNHSAWCLNGHVLGTNGCVCSLLILILSFLSNNNLLSLCCLSLCRANVCTSLVHCILLNKVRVFKSLYCCICFSCQLICICLSFLSCLRNLLCFLFWCLLLLLRLLCL